MSGAIGITCPHCSAPLLRLGLNEAFFDRPYDLACFNDECPYYVRGWGWMELQYGVKASYRYRLNPLRGDESPLPVWSPTALRGSILGDDPPGPAAEGRP
jgi:hypothetical protein